MSELFLFGINEFAFFFISSINSGIMSRVGQAGSWPSTGFLAMTFGIALAQHFGARATVYGFGACVPCNRYFACESSGGQGGPEAEGGNGYHPFGYENQ